MTTWGTALHEDANDIATSSSYGDRGDGSSDWFIYTKIRDVAAAGILKAEDAAHVSGDAGVMALGVTKATPTSLGGDGDYHPVLLDNAGKLWVTGTYLEDAAHTSADKGIQVLSVRKATPAAQTDADGDYASVLTDANGALWTRRLPIIQTVKVASAGLTTATTAYTSGDQMGTEMTFAGMSRDSGGGGLLRGAILWDRAKIVYTGDVDLYLFSAASTPAADNAAADWSDTNMELLVAKISFLTASWKSGSSNAFCQVDGLTIPYQCAATSLFGCFVTRQANTFFTAVTDLQVTLKCERD